MIFVLVFFIAMIYQVYAPINEILSSQGYYIEKKNDSKIVKNFFWETPFLGFVLFFGKFPSSNGFC